MGVLEDPIYKLFSFFVRLFELPRRHLAVQVRPREYLSQGCLKASDKLFSFSTTKWCCFMRSSGEYQAMGYKLLSCVCIS